MEDSDSEPWFEAVKIVESREVVFSSAKKQSLEKRSSLNGSFVLQLEYGGNARDSTPCSWHGESSYKGLNFWNERVEINSNRVARGLQLYDCGKWAIEWKYLLSKHRVNDTKLAITTRMVMMIIMMMMIIFRTSDPSRECLDHDGSRSSFK